MVHGNDAGGGHLEVLSTLRKPATIKHVSLMSAVPKLTFYLVDAKLAHRYDNYNTASITQNYWVIAFIRGSQYSNHCFALSELGYLEIYCLRMCICLLARTSADFHFE